MTQSNFMKKLMATRCKLTSYKGDGRSREYNSDAEFRSQVFGLRMQSDYYHSSDRYGECFEGIRKVYHSEMRRCKFNTIDMMKDEQLQKEFDENFVDGDTICMAKIIIQQQSLDLHRNEAREWLIHPDNNLDGECNFASVYVAHHVTKKIFDGYSGSSSDKRKNRLPAELQDSIFDSDEYEDVIFFFDTPEESYNCERRLIHALSKTIPKEFQKGEYYRNTGNRLTGNLWADANKIGPIRLANIANGGQGRRYQMCHTGEWFIYQNKITKEIQIHENQVYHTDRENWRWEKVDRSMSVPGHRDQIDILKESARYLNIAPKYLKRLQDIY